MSCKLWNLENGSCLLTSRIPTFTFELLSNTTQQFLHFAHPGHYWWFRVLFPERCTLTYAACLHFLGKLTSISVVVPLGLLSLCPRQHIDSVSQKPSGWNQVHTAVGSDEGAAHIGSNPAYHLFWTHSTSIQHGSGKCERTVGVHNWWTACMFFLTNFICFFCGAVELQMNCEYTDRDINNKGEKGTMKKYSKLKKISVVHFSLKSNRTSSLKSPVSKWLPVHRKLFYLY